MKTIIKKTSVLVIGITVLINSSSKAQDDFKKFVFGLKTEGKLTWFKPDNKNMTNAGIRLGYSYGLMADYFFGKNYAFSTGITVSTNGGKIKYDYDTLAFSTEIPTDTSTSPFTTSNATQLFGTSATYTYKITDVEVPLMLKFRTNEIGYMKYFGMFGLGTHFRWKAKGNYAYDLAPIESSLQNNGQDPAKTQSEFEDVDFSNQISFLRLSLIIGGGFEYNLSGNTSFVVGISFKNGINNTFSKKIKVNNQKIENRTATASDIENQPIYINENGTIYEQAETQNGSPYYKLSSENFQYTGAVKKAITNQICLTVGIVF